jgi:hypothetical protein
MAVSEATLMAIFEESMREFLKHERDEILDGINERSSCGRLSHYLQSAAHRHGLPEYYYSDTEYNRKQNGEVKTIIDQQMKVIRINCDLLLHSRGKNVAQDNLISIEMKKMDAPAAEKQKDRDRLRALTKSSYDDVWSNDGVTNPEHVCGYMLGVYIELDRKERCCYVEYYRQGCVKDTRQIPL